MSAKSSFTMTAVVNEGQRVGQGDVVMTHRITTLSWVKNHFCYCSCWSPCFIDLKIHVWASIIGSTIKVTFFLYYQNFSQHINQMMPLSRFVHLKPQRWVFSYNASKCKNKNYFAKCFIYSKHFKNVFIFFLGGGLWLDADIVHKDGLKCHNGINGRKSEFTTNQSYLQMDN